MMFLGSITAVIYKYTPESQCFLYKNRLAVSLIFVFLILLDLTGHSLRAKSGLSAEMGTKPQSGAALALDNFTAGHNSMTMLTTIKFDIIKFDRSPVSFKSHDVRSQEVSIKVLESFVGLSKQLGLNTTLEGIET
ncbi:EAL domain-containing protein [Vibrio rotiferianus]|uniref:EAL domain-containing protein n=1 Tax=Vibrio rotiferianus TaxID=190895 RepID=UPI00406A2BCF